MLVLLATVALGALSQPVTLREPRVSPARVYFGRAPVTIRFDLDTPGATDLHVEVVSERTGRIARRLVVPAAPPGATRVRWDGVTGAGDAAADGRYRVRAVVPATGQRRLLGAFSLRGRMYPIRGPHVDRGPIGLFGVVRNGGRTHEGYDVNAACGVPLVAARGGEVIRSRYDPVLYGHDVIVRGRLDGRTYRYSHLRDTPLVKKGDTVRTGQRIGYIGATGNARSIGCHLHFELRARNGRLLDPAPHLHEWDRWS